MMLVEVIVDFNMLSVLMKDIVDNVKSTLIVTVDTVLMV